MKTSKSEKNFLPDEPLRGMGRSPFWADAPRGHSHRWLDSPRSSGFLKCSSSGLEGGSNCDDRIDQESLHELHKAGKQADSEVEMDESRHHGEPAAHKVQP